MSNSKNKLPLYRVHFASIIGTDENGKDKLGNSVEIGAVWQRKQADKGAILKLNVVPQNMSEGVVFLHPVETNDQGYA